MKKLSEVNDEKEYKITKINDKKVEEELGNYGITLNDKIRFERRCLFQTPIQVVSNNCILLSLGAKEAKSIEIEEIENDT